ncbi:TraB/GumN family protein [Alkalibacillus silvisoli]|uniref:TraB/GumN family protein n=1 Tax=Alkalibacillus silvisoli TaxID=392823 RepID=A0ABP3JR36_9BACI
MKKMLVLLAISLIVVTGCQSDSLDVSDVDIPERSEGFFWEAEHHDKTIYFLGTVHVGVEEMYPLRDEIEMAMDEADLLLTEIDASDEQRSEEMVSIQEQYITLNEGERLEDYLDEKYIEEVEWIAENPGIEYEMLNVLQPWIVEELYNEMLIIESDYDFEYGVESYLYENVLENADSMALEDYEERLQAVRARDMNYQIYMLEETLEHTKEVFDEEIEKSVTAFRAGEEALINHERKISEESENPNIEETYLNEMLFNRDERMAERVDEVVQNHDADTLFVAAGALHFFGEGNIIELLEEKGYEIERR